MTTRAADDVLAKLLGPEGPVCRFPVGERAEEHAALVALLLANRTGDDPRTPEVARAIASGCLGEQHLWHDLGLPDRTSLRTLLESHFAPLAAENDRDMRWKLFLYRKLCGWNGFST